MRRGGAGDGTDRRAATRGFGAETALIGTVQTVGLAAGYLFLSLDHEILSAPRRFLFGTFLGVATARC